MKNRSLATSRIAYLFVLLTLLFITACTHHGMAHRFDDVDLWAKIFEDPQREEWQKPDEVVKVMNLKPGDIVADIGAGTGYFTRRFAVAVGPQGKALGLDTEPGMVDYMKRDAGKLGLKNYEARLVKPDDPGLGPGSMDMIFICDTLHHIENRINYLRNLIPVLKPGGRVVVVDFYDRSLPVGPRGGKLSETVVESEFRMAGYRLTKSLNFLPYQYYLEFQPA